jgi:hypothetical protein
MAKKVKATTTINPLHFEDLEPHRFEDLVRRLLYGFRDWNNIEATGKAGSDEGFDVRAWEASDAVTNVGDEGEEGVRASEGRLWQVQAKREKTITPGKMGALIEEGVNGVSPPYGYILAAATNISKTAYDTFRERLREKGVREFYFWGKDYLEDQLSLPQNDEILFTFFGLSLSPRRRSRTAELKFGINNKNKILKLVFENDVFSDQTMKQKGFLLRDIKAEHYPDKLQYPDFEKCRRWEEHYAAHVSANGVFFKLREYYAHLDAGKRQWDFSLTIDLTLRENNVDQANEARLEDEGKKAERFWKHLPRRTQAKLMRYGFVRFEDMLIIDDKGDPEYKFPHVYIDFGPIGPFQYVIGNLVQNHTAIHENELRKFKRAKIFPATFPDPVKAEIHDLTTLGLSAQSVKSLELLRGGVTIYSVDDKMGALAVGSIIRIPEKDDRHPEKYVEVTFVNHTTAAELLKQGFEHGRPELESYIGRKLADEDGVVVCDLHEVGLSSADAHLHYLENRWSY